LPVRRDSAAAKAGELHVDVDATRDMFMNTNVPAMAAIKTFFIGLQQKLGFILLRRFPPQRRKGAKEEPPEAIEAP